MGMHDFNYSSENSPPYRRGVDYGNEPYSSNYRAGQPYERGRWTDWNERDWERGRGDRFDEHGQRRSQGIWGVPSGPHAGRGPKNYRRPDERIREDINDRLTESPEVDATEIEVRVENGEVTLTGIVDSRHAKRIAEDLAENVAGVKDVHNQIRVQEQQRRYDPVRQDAERTRAELSKAS
jgi:BON domain